MPIKIGNTAVKLPVNIAKVMVGSSQVYAKAAGYNYAIAYDTTVGDTYLATHSGLIVKNDKLYGAAINSDGIILWDISSGGDVLTYDQIFSTASYEGNPRGVCIWGDKLYMAGSSSSSIYRYSIGANGNLSYDDYSIDITNENDSPRWIEVHGDKLYLGGNTSGYVYRYSIGTGGTLTLDATVTDISAEISSSYASFVFGGKLFIGLSDGLFKRYSIAGNGDLSFDGATHDLDVSNEISGPVVGAAIYQNILYVGEWGSTLVRKYNIT